VFTKDDGDKARTANYVEIFAAFQHTSSSFWPLPFLHSI